MASMTNLTSLLGGVRGVVDAARRQPHDSVGPPGNSRIVRDEHYRKPVGVVQLAERVEDSGTRGLVEVARRLIGQEHPWPRDERPGDRHPLHLATGKLPRLVPQTAAEAEAIEKPPRGVAGLAANPQPLQHTVPHHQGGEHVFQGVEFG